MSKAKELNEKFDEMLNNVEVSDDIDEVLVSYGFEFMRHVPNGGASYILSGTKTKKEVRVLDNDYWNVFHYGKRVAEGTGARELDKYLGDYYG